MARDAHEDSRPTGFLQVFSATETRPDGDSTYAYPHTAYTISDRDGKSFKYVRNHIGRMDGVPTVVTVPVGQYRIKAQTEDYGDVTFTIEVRPGRVDVVHLERDLKHPGARHDEAQLIRLANGQIVGWHEGSAIRGSF